MLTLEELSRFLDSLEAKRSNKRKIDLAADFFSALSPDDLTSVLNLLTDNTASGIGGKTLMLAISDFVDPQKFQSELRSTGDVGEAIAFSLRSNTTQTSLTREPLYVQEVIEVLRIASRLRDEKIALLRKAISRCSPLEAKYLAKIILRDLRIGFSNGLLLSSLASLFNLDLARVKRMAAFFPVYELPVMIKRGALRIPRPLQPFKPMLAERASDPEEVIKRQGKTSLERKIDGFRAMIHKSGSTVKIYSRRLQDVTEKLPDVVRVVEDFDDEFILDCEIAGFKNGRIMPFQRMMRRFRKYDIGAIAREISLRPFIFDVPYLNGRSLIDESYEKRRRILEDRFAYLTVDRTVTDDLKEVRSSFRDSVKMGYEGLVAKDPSSPYLPGERSPSWLKLKRIPEPLDLVIMEAQWGYGRRHNYLSDYTLGAFFREGLTPIGKSYKGLTDKEMEELTAKLLALKLSEEYGKVMVKPEIVVEVMYDDIQKSSRYSCGYALRQARIGGIRWDKTPEEADDLKKIQMIYRKMHG